MGIVNLSDSYTTNGGAASSGVAPSHAALFNVARNTGLFYGSTNVAIGDIGSLVFFRYGNIITISTRLDSSLNFSGYKSFYDGTIYPGKLYVPNVECFSFSGVGAIYQFLGVTASGGEIYSLNYYEQAVYSALNDGLTIYLTGQTIQGPGRGRPVFNVVLPAKYDVDGNALVQL